MEPNNEESNNNDVLIIKEEDINNNSIPKVKIIFQDSTALYFPLSLIEDINPSFLFSYSLVHSSLSTIEIHMPDYITSNLLQEFLSIFKNGITHYDKSTDNSGTRLPILLKISEFFQLREFSAVIIQDLILASINKNNALDLLLFSYEKLVNAQRTDQQCHQNWFELFFRSLEKLGRNFCLILQNVVVLLALDHKVLDELLNKCFECLFCDNYILVENGSNRSVSSNEFNGDNYFDNVNNEYNPQEDLMINKHEVNVYYNNTEGNNHKGIYANIGNGNNNTNSNNNFISNDHLAKLIEIYGVIKQNNSNIYELLTNEYMALSSPNSINELNQRINPTFLLKIPLDVDSFYEEYAVDVKLNGKQIVIIVFYKKNEDSFNVNIKLSNKPKLNSYLNSSPVDDKYHFKVVTFLTSAFIEDEEYNQINVKSISNNKSSINIFKLCNFKQIINERTSRLNDKSVNKSNNASNVNFKLNLKICNTHSIISSYLLKNYYKYSEDSQITKLPKDLLVLLLKNKYLSKRKEDDIVIGLINWLKDEINLKEDINELLDVIQWDKIDESLLFEFFIKYSHMIYNEETEVKIIQLLQKKYTSKKMKSEDIIKQLFSNFMLAAKRVDYSGLYSTIKKNEKITLIQKSNSNKNQFIKDAHHSFLKKKESTSQETIEIVLTQTNNDNSQIYNSSQNVNNAGGGSFPLKDQLKKESAFNQKRKSKISSTEDKEKEKGKDKDTADDLNTEQENHYFKRVMTKEKCFNHSKHILKKTKVNERTYFKEKQKPICTKTVFQDQNNTTTTTNNNNNNNTHKPNSKSYYNLSIFNLNKNSPKLKIKSNNTKSMAQLVLSKKNVIKSPSKSKKSEVRRRNMRQGNSFLSFASKSQYQTTETCINKSSLQNEKLKLLHFPSNKRYKLAKKSK